MNICFIINPWEKLDPEDDSTLRLIHESVIRGHNTGILYPHNLTIRESQTMGFVRKIKKQDKYPSSMPAFHRKIEFREQLLPLSGFDVIFARNNPPIDPVMLNFLDSVKDDTFIINDIDGLRKANNKLYPASFHDNEIIPVTYVSKSKTVLKKAILESPKDRMILEKSALHNINSLLDFYISGTKEGNYVILQEFIEGAEEGDVRVLMLNGQPLGAYRRIPAGDDIRSNIKAGGSARKHSLTKQEKVICKRIGPKLVADGLYFVGLDIINGKLIEINVCSPGGITRINTFNRTRLQKKVIDFLEEVISARETAIERKKHFKRMIDEA